MSEIGYRTSVTAATTSTANARLASGPSPLFMSRFLRALHADHPGLLLQLGDDAVQQVGGDGIDVLEAVHTRADRADRLGQQVRQRADQLRVVLRAGAERRQRRLL